MTPRTLVSSAAASLLMGVVLVLNGATSGPLPASVTPTPCDPWAAENMTPIPGRNKMAAPCAVVAFNATSTTYAATVTAGIIDGSHYGLHISNSAPNWTPTVYPYGTVPPEVMAGYPLTLTALPWPTPHGWCLRDDHWETTCEGQP